MRKRDIPIFIVLFLGVIVSASVSCFVIFILICNLCHAFHSTDSFFSILNATLLMVVFAFCIQPFVLVTFFLSILLKATINEKIDKYF
jgi:amino acid transporter